MERFKKKKAKVNLFVWSTGDHYWGGWQGFTGVYSSKGRAMDRIKAERNRQNNRAQIVDYRTLKVIANYEKQDGKWVEVKDGK